MVEGGGHDRSNCDGHRIDVCYYPLRGNSDDAVALCLQEAQADLITLRTICAVVRLTVDLDNQARFTTVKVDDTRPDRMLATKFATRLLATQFLPQHSLGQRQFPAQAAGDRHFRA